MGQKIHPTGFRLPVTRAWASRWFATNRNFSQMLAEDLQVHGEDEGVALRRRRAFAAQADGARREVVAVNAETSPRPRERVMTRAAAGDGDGFAGQPRVLSEKVHEAGRGFAFFPRHVAGLVTLLPICAHFRFTNDD